MKLFNRRLAAPVLSLLAALALAFAPALAFAAPGVTADVAADLVGTYTGTNSLGAVTFGFTLKGLNRFTPGTTTGKADKLYSGTLTISASSSQNLDLAGSLTDPFGAALTFVTVKSIYVHAASGNTNNVCFGGAATNTFVGPFADATDVVCVKPGGVALISVQGAGWTVTPATGDLLKFANSGAGTSVSADVVIIGTSA